MPKKVRGFFKTTKLLPLEKFALYGISSNPGIYSTSNQCQHQEQQEVSNEAATERTRQDGRLIQVNDYNYVV